MLVEYVAEALRRARYEKIDDAEPFYGEVRGLRGVWAKGHTLEECRSRLAEVVDGWIIVRLSKGLSIPPLGRYRIQRAEKMRVRELGSVPSRCSSL